MGYKKIAIIGLVLIAILSLYWWFELRRPPKVRKYIDETPEDILTYYEDDRMAELPLDLIKMRKEKLLNYQPVKNRLLEWYEKLDQFMDETATEATLYRGEFGKTLLSLNNNDGLNLVFRKRQLLVAEVRNQIRDKFSVEKIGSEIIRRIVEIDQLEKPDLNSKFIKERTMNKSFKETSTVRQKELLINYKLSEKSFFTGNILKIIEELSFSERDRLKEVFNRYEGTRNHELFWPRRITIDYNNYTIFHIYIGKILQLYEKLLWKKKMSKMKALVIMNSKQLGFEFDIDSTFEHPKHGDIFRKQWAKIQKKSKKLLKNWDI